MLAQLQRRYAAIKAATAAVEIASVPVLAPAPMPAPALTRASELELAAEPEPELEQESEPELGRVNVTEPAAEPAVESAGL